MMDSLNDFKALHLKIRFRLVEAGVLPTYKGSMLHGLMGQGLISIDSRLYQALYAQHDPQQPKAYSFICNDIIEKTPDGYILSFDLRLFGDAIQCSNTLIEALQSAAEKYGIGPQRIKGQLVSLSSMIQGKEVAGIHPFYLIDAFKPPQIASNECALELTSPLRVKHHGKVLRVAPSLSMLVNSIARRFNSLCQFWHQDNHDLSDYILGSIPNVDHVETIDHTYWQEWQRYSKQNRSLCQFGGLQGMISYQGHIERALPWLQLGQYLQVGNKTTFGLGSYHLITSEQSC